MCAMLPATMGSTFMSAAFMMSRFRESSFDLIVLNQVIEHVPDPEASLRKIKQRLNPGGRVVLSFPNAASWQRKLTGKRWINWHVPYHQHHFNRHSFKRLAERAGFEAVGRIRTITPNLWTLLQLHALKKAPAEGQASPIWSSRSGGRRKASLFTRGWNAGMAMLKRLSAVAVAIVNRIMDALGQGDSLLIELRPMRALS